MDQDEDQVNLWNRSFKILCTLGSDFDMIKIKFVIVKITLKTYLESLKINLMFNF